MVAPLRGPEPLEAHHDTATFDCGVPALNNFLARFALVNQHSGAARTYVALRGTRVTGYYSLAAASVELERTTPRVAKGLALHAIPLTLLARLAVDRSEQGAGLGQALLKDAIKRHLQAEAIIGSRALLVHPKYERAAAFYACFGFQPSRSDPLHLFLLTKDMKRILEPRQRNVDHGFSAPRRTRGAALEPCP
jgi:GNAT superfamily N-acetyltransferase